MESHDESQHIVIDDPDNFALLLVQQYLSERGYESALQATEAVHGLTYLDSKLPRGSMLMEVCWSTRCAHSQLNTPQHPPRWSTNLWNSSMHLHLHAPTTTNGRQRSARTPQPPTPMPYTPPSTPSLPAPSHAWPSFLTTPSWLARAVGRCARWT